ncbi:MAG TPA: outer membrane lipid asymmetry maintenance protein MlaD [Rhizomicrobium sp.]|nr:outer membrane lipid asymmetry maintenance protein MlaD [Rhizomicrobium sp.]
MQNTTTETLIGLLVVVVIAGLLFFGYSASGRGGVGGYDVKASFSAVDGVAPGTDVRLNGIKIGTVSSMELNPQTYQAVLHMNIRSDVKIPDDSSVKVTSAGLLGGEYLAIVPGGSDKMLASGGVLTNTQGSIDFASLIGRVIYGNSGSK